MNVWTMSAADLETSAFARPGQLASYVGLVMREASSGDRQRLGSITKAGNSHCRHVLVQAAWSYRHRPATSADLKRRQTGQPTWRSRRRFKPPRLVTPIALAILTPPVSGRC